MSRVGKYEPYRKEIELLAECYPLSKIAEKFIEHHGFGTIGGIQNYMRANGIVSGMRAAWNMMTPIERVDFANRWRKMQELFKGAKR